MIPHNTSCIYNKIPNLANIIDAIIQDLIKFQLQSRAISLKKAYSLHYQLLQ